MRSSLRLTINVRVIQNQLFRDVRLSSRVIYVQDLLTRVQWTPMHVHGVRRTLIAKIFIEIPKIITNVDHFGHKFRVVKHADMCHNTFFEMSKVLARFRDPI